MQVNVEDTSYDWSPMVVVDSAGTAWVFWMGIDASQGDFEIMYSRWRGEGWTPEERVHPDNVQKDAWHMACIGEDGIPWVVWERYRGGTSPYCDVLTTHWAGAGWCEPETLYAAGIEGQGYEMGCVDTTSVWAVVGAFVNRHPGYDLDLFFRNRVDGVWSSLEHIDHPEVQDGYPDIAVSGLGVPWVVWEAMDHVDTLHCVYRDEGTWRESPLSIRGGGPKICFSSGEGPWIVYFDTTSNICAGFWDGAGWSISGSIPLPPADPSEWDYGLMVSGSVEGGPVVAWARADHDNVYKGDVYVSRWSDCWWTGEEMVTEPDSELAATDEWPDVGVGTGGRVWVVWERSRGPSGSDYDIWARYSDDFLSEPWVKGFSARVEGERVVVEWSCRGQVRFNVYRADAGGCGEPDAEGERELVYTVEPLVDVESFVDSTVELGRRYRYWLEVESPFGELCEEAGPVLVRPCEGGVRVGFIGVRPNPSGVGFMLGYYAGARREAEFEVLDLSGRLVRRIECSGGEGEVLWDGRDERGKEVRPGVYFARFLAGGCARGGVQKLVVLR
ncbi:MAG: hypothetical protein NTX17_10295 [Candidatus Eisenbacteria bacterium]|nr:hypothetical protein [Candidatus Eisenbacteria bacterium]